MCTECRRLVDEAVAAPEVFTGFASMVRFRRVTLVCRLNRSTFMPLFDHLRSMWMLRSEPNPDAILIRMFGSDIYHTPSPETWRWLQSHIAQGLHELYAPLLTEVSMIPDRCLSPSVPAGRFCRNVPRPGDGVTVRGL
jgi:hypothetical protein